MAVYVEKKCNTCEKHYTCVKGCDPPEPHYICTECALREHRKQIVIDILTRNHTSEKIQEMLNIIVSKMHVYDVISFIEKYNT